MLRFITVRIEAARLARELADSLGAKLAAGSPLWVLDTSTGGTTAIIGGADRTKPAFRVTIIARRFRVFDTIRLYCYCSEVWLPLGARLRLRTALRLYAADKATEVWKTVMSPDNSRRRQDG